MPKLPYHYDAEIFAKLADRCRRETKFGLVANLIINCAIRVLIPIKKIRVRSQRQVQRIRTSLERVFTKGNEREMPVPRYWQRPLTKVSSGFLGQRPLIIAEMSIVQCRKYRVQQKIDALSLVGIQATGISFTDMQACWREIPLASCVIFYRTPYIPAVQGYIDECKRLGIPTVYDIDDLVFDVPEYEKHPVFRTMPEREKAQFLKGAELYQQCLSACDHAIASTPTLAEYMKRYAKGSVFLIENSLDEMLLRVGERSAARRADGPHIVIGYGSGTKSHDEDFAQAVPALALVMQKYPEVRLALHGHLQLPAELAPFMERIHRVGFLEPEDYYGAVGSFSINLAPLLPGPFNDAKSNIKYLEAAICGVPTVSSNCAAFRQEIINGHNGFLASTTEEWFQALERLILDPDLRREVGQNAKAAVLAKYHPQVLAGHLRAVLSAVAPSEAPRSAKPVLLLVNTLFAPQSFGGATIVVEQLAQRLASHWRVVVVCTNREDLPEFTVVRYEANGFPVFSVRSPADLDLLGSYSSDGVRAVFSRIIENVGPRVVHFHSIQGLGADMLAVCKEKGVTTAVTMHDAWWVCARQFMLMPSGKGCFQKHIDLRICSACTGQSAFVYRRSRIVLDQLQSVRLVLAPGAFHRDFLQQNLPGVDVRVNKNGILLPRNVQPRKARPDGVVRLAYLGGGNADHKGYFLLQRVFANLKHSNYELILVDIHRKLGVNEIKADDWKVKGRLTIAAPFDASSIDDFYQGIDVLLFPSQIHESFGLTVREALVRNAWVVTTDSGGVAEDIVEGENGNVVPIGDEGAFGRAIDQLLSNPDKFDGYQNPHASLIRGFDEQVSELDDMLARLVGRGHLEADTSV